MPSTQPHVAYLDSVRGLAALAVIGSHYVRAYDLPCRSNFCDRLLTYSPLHIWWDGEAAVSLFFVLSGLVLSLKHFRLTTTPDLSNYHFLAFILGRIFRIWPAYLLVLVVSALLYQRYQWCFANFPATVPRQNGWLSTLWGQPAGWADFLNDSFLLGMRMKMVFVPQAWTLSIELALSLLVPVGILLVARSTSWLVFFSLFAIFPLGVSAFLFHFMLGIVIAKHKHTLSLWLRSNRVYKHLAWLCGLFLYTMGETSDAWVSPDAIGWLTGLGAGVLLASVIASAKSQRILSLPILRYLGKISYSIYLIHFAVLINTTPLLLHQLNASDDAFLFAWWLGFVATIACSVCLAALSYRFVEVPSMALGKRLGRTVAAGGFLSNCRI